MSILVLRGRNVACVCPVSLWALAGFQLALFLSVQLWHGQHSALARALPEPGQEMGPYRSVEEMESTRPWYPTADFSVSSCTCNLVREQSYPLKITIIAHFLPYSVKNWTSNDNNISIIVCISPSHMWISLDNMYTLRYLHLSLKLVYSKFT